MVEPGDKEDDVDVGGDDLLLGGLAGGAAREALGAGRTALMRRVAVAGRRLDGDPVADRGEIGARRRRGGAAVRTRARNSPSAASTR